MQTGGKLSFPAIAGTFRLAATLNPCHRREAITASRCDGVLALRFSITDAWSPVPYMRARTMSIIKPSSSPGRVDDAVLATVTAAQGDHELFYTLVQLCVVSEHSDHFIDWPKYWLAGDAASTVQCRDREKRRNAHGRCRQMSLASLHPRLVCHGNSRNAQLSLELVLCLEAGAFELDRRLSAGFSAGGFANRDEFEAALLGDRGHATRDVRKALRRLLLSLAEKSGSGLSYGGRTCLDTMNGYGGVRRDEVVMADGEAVPSQYELGRLVESASRSVVTTNKTPPLSSRSTGSDDEHVERALRGMKSQTALHPFQKEGIAWMARKEAQLEEPTLHPAWIELSLACGQTVYVHSWTGELSQRFFPAPRAETAGGMMCDDVGLGKSLQMLGLILARPPPDGWAVEALPTRTCDVVPVKATLIVAPAALLPQWEAEVHKHCKEDALKYCTYRGLGSSVGYTGGNGSGSSGRRARSSGGDAEMYSSTDQNPLSTQSRSSETEAGSVAMSAGCATRQTRGSRRASVRAAAIDWAAAVDGAAAPNEIAGAETLPHAMEPRASGVDSQGFVGGSGDDDGMEVELLAATRRDLFCDGGGAARVEECDVVLCSFECLRDDLRKTGRAEGGRDLPLGALGFWRVVLDEAQLVAQTTSKAALICSELWRRHAWVATGTPINAKLTELSGLLAFLGTKPFVDATSLHRLLLSGFRERLPYALPRMRTLLRALMLRRSQQDGAIQAQINLPPVTWETRTLELTHKERVAYAVALEQLKRSHRTYARFAATRTGGRQGCSNMRSRLLGQLNGDLTRVRQTVCHHTVVNGARKAAGNMGAGERLPHRLILQRLVARAAAERDAAEATLWRAKALLHVAAAATNATQRRRKSVLNARSGGGLPDAVDHGDGFVDASGARQEARESGAEERVDCGAGLDVNIAQEMHTSFEAMMSRAEEEREQASDAHVARLLADSVKQLSRTHEAIEQILLGGLASDQARDFGSQGKLMRSSKRRRESAGTSAHGAFSMDEHAADREERQQSARNDELEPATSRRSVRRRSVDAANVEAPVLARTFASGSTQSAEAQRAVEKAAEAARLKRGAHAYLSNLAAVAASTSQGLRHQADASGGGSVAAASEVAIGDEVAMERAEGAADEVPTSPTDEGVVLTETCPICLEGRGASAWSVTACGHHGCYECMQTAIVERQACPCCKRPASLEMLYEIESEALCADGAGGNAEGGASAAALARERNGAERLGEIVAAEYGSKVSALLSEVGELAESGERVVIFSAWTRLLKLAGEALSAHGVAVASLIGSPALKRDALAAFSTPVVDGGATALLVPLFGGASGAGGGGAAGLTLTQAHTAFLLEPALQPGIERQAAGRIARIGQTRPTRCVRLIVGGTIECKILAWQQMRLAEGASAAPQLSLNDFVQLVDGE